MSDAELFRGFYQKCYPNVLAYAASLVGRQAGEDIASETFMVAWRRHEEVQPMTLPWLLGVARNHVYEMMRNDARQYELAVAEGLRISTQSEGDDPAEDVTERLSMLGALAHMSEADRELLTLIAWQGMSISQAAKVLGCSSATLSVRLHRARYRLVKMAESPMEQQNCAPDEERATGTAGKVPGPRKDCEAKVGPPGPKTGGVAKAPAGSVLYRRMLAMMKEAEGA